MIKYSAVVKWSDEDNGFIAIFPELHGLSAFGETQEEAIRELHLAAKGFIESIESSGEQLPPPNQHVPHSGQIRLRMPKRLHARLAYDAEIEGISLNTYIVSALSAKYMEKQTTRDIIEIKKILQEVHAVTSTIGLEDAVNSSFYETENTGVREKVSNAESGKYEIDLSGGSIQ